jgi:hypothetical protein
VERICGESCGALKKALKCVRSDMFTIQSNARNIEGRIEAIRKSTIAKSAPELERSRIEVLIQKQVTQITGTLPLQSSDVSPAPTAPTS